MLQGHLYNKILLLKKTFCLVAGSLIPAGANWVTLVLRIESHRVRLSPVCDEISFLHGPVTWNRALSVLGIESCQVKLGLVSVLGSEYTDVTNLKSNVPFAFVLISVVVRSVRVVLIPIFAVWHIETFSGINLRPFLRGYELFFFLLLGKWGKAISLMAESHAWP